LISWLQNQENITFLIAVLGFLMSLGSWVYTGLMRRKKLRFKVHAWQQTDDVFYIFLQIENFSELPISITRIQAFISGEPKDCTAIPTFVYGYRKLNDTDQIASKEFFSMQMPIELNPLGSVSGFVLFEGLPEAQRTISTPVRLQISTNRGAAMKIELPLSQDSRHKF